jgi:hypothetical protein
LAERFGIKITVGTGLVVAAGGMLYLSHVAAVDTDYTVVLTGLCIVAVGLGLAMSPATNSVMGSVPLSKAGIGSAMNDTTRQVGGALGVAVLGTILNKVYLDRIEPMLDFNNPLYNSLPAGILDILRSNMNEGVLEAIRSGIQGAHVVAEHIPLQTVAQIIHNTASKAFVTGMADALFVAMFIMLAAALLAFAILPARIRRPEEDKTNPDL